jgi:release factor glutamine methyltransferase
VGDGGPVGTPPGVPEGAVSWRQLLAEAERRLADAAADPTSEGHDSIDPGTTALDARRIVERASGFEGAEWVLGLDEPATQRGVHFFDVMVERRLTGEPLQYVLGRWGFRTLDLMVDRRALIPRPETEVVVEAALAELDRLSPRARAAGRAPCVVDLGTGTGAIALSIAAERPGTDVWATDASADAIAVARANLPGIGRAATRVRIVEGDWFAALPSELRGSIDLLVSNPPYVAAGDPLPPVVERWEPASALRSGPDGLDDLATIVLDGLEWLADGGAVVVELDPRQVPAVDVLARTAGFAEVAVVPDLAGRHRAVIARR